jgi:hypothetical protein
MTEQQGPLVGNDVRIRSQLIDTDTKKPITTAPDEVIYWIAPPSGTPVIEKRLSNGDVRQITVDTYEVVFRANASRQWSWSARSDNPRGRDRGVIFVEPDPLFQEG